MKKFFWHIKNYFIPTVGNKYHPHFFRKQTIIAVVAVLVFLQVGYFVQTTLVFNKTGFLAAVLPGVLTALTNDDRATNGVGTLIEEPLLTQAAEKKAADMAEKGYFAHVAPDGTTPWHWLDLVGYNYSYAGENLAVNFTESKDVEDAWMKSPTHRANIVKSEFTRIGIGTAQGVYEGKDVTFVVQFFATPASGGKPASTPVSTKTTPTKTVPATELATSDTVSSNVLGSETNPSLPTAANNPIVEGLVSAAASPNQTLLYILGGLIGLIALLLFLAIFMHMKVQYLGVIGGGLLLLCLAIGSFYFTAETHVSNVDLPADSQATVSP
ncbi:MAG: CAP domain-containing protein [Candidatus Paceibacterota bacterium]